MVHFIAFLLGEVHLLFPTSTVAMNMAVLILNVDISYCHEKLVQTIFNRIITGAQILEQRNETQPSHVGTAESPGYSISIVAP